jgi:hypothetical protein
MFTYVQSGKGLQLTSVWIVVPLWMLQVSYPKFVHQILYRGNKKCLQIGPSVVWNHQVSERLCLTNPEA